MSIIRTVKQEFEQALQEKRQPNCPYCRKPLVVEQEQTDSICWLWNSEQNRYEQYEEESCGDEPRCMSCASSDPDFLSLSSTVDELCERLGLTF